ncbi:MAG: type II toxin-antitoxin system RelE/ParE family toxin [Thermoproteota archaeon]
MPRYRILVSRRAARFIGEVEQRLRKRIISEIKDLENFPFFTEPHDIAKLKGKEDYYRLRVRSTRIIFKVNEKQRTIYVEKIGFRGKIYK